MPKAALLGAARSPFGRLGGSLAGLSAADLGQSVARGLLKRLRIDPAMIDEAIVGCVLQAGQGMNVARQVAISAGIPVERPATTVNQVCASSLAAIELAARQIQAGEAELVLAGGTESMSTAPHLLRSLRAGARYGPAELEDAVLTDGLMDAFEHVHMGMTAERLIGEYAISRSQQDEYALASQERYRAAAKFLTAEMVMVTCAVQRGQPIPLEDQLPRSTSLEKLAALPAAFCAGGSITAGNASGLADGAAMALVASPAASAGQNLAPLAQLEGFATVGVEPRRMGIGPAPAIRALLARHQLDLEAIALFEINEAFAGQVLAVLAELGLDQSRVNVNGGAIALGHPLAATGGRMLASLAGELTRRGGGLGIAALCVGGGMGKAALISV